MLEKITIYVELLEEGTDTWRATKAINLGNGTYQLLPTENYDPEDEIWAFLPGTIVGVKQSSDFHGRLITIAVKTI